MNQTFTFNPNYQVRDNLLGIDINWDKEENSDDIAEFEDLDYLSLQELINAKFINPASRQNASPLFGDFLDFLSRYPSVKTFGYAVSPNREDYRIALTGLTVDGQDVSKDLRACFAKFAKTADEIDLTDDLYCWWD